MKPLIPFRYMLAITHGSVFLFTALFIGFSTYFIAKDSLEYKASNLPQISERANAQNNQEYLIYERREVLATRLNDLNKERVTGYAKNLSDGEENIVYSFIDDPLEKSMQKTTPTTVILKNGNIFINGVSEFGYAVLNLFGENLTADYKILKNRDFPLANTLFPNEKEIIYTYGGPNSREKDSRHKIYWKLADGKKEIFDSETFPSENVWIAPVGWNSSGNYFYVQRLSNSPTYAKIWKVGMQNNTLKPLESIKGAFAQNTHICSEQDYAVFIANPTDPTFGSLGRPAAPSKIYVSNLEKDSSTMIYYSKSVVSNLLVSCASRKILVKENDSYRLFDIKGNPLPLNYIFGDPDVFANDGKTIVTQQNGKLTINNIQNGKRQEKNPELDEEGKIKIRYNLVGISSQ